MYEIKLHVQGYLEARRSNSAWQLLAARNAPIILGCLQALFKESQDGIEFETALQALAELLEEYAYTDELGISRDQGFGSQARKELRNWIRRRLIIEREGRIYATDALESAIIFIDSLDQRLMTSTASRLAVVEREIENLEVRLNPDPKVRSQHLRQKIAELEGELERVEAGELEILNHSESIEGVRELYNLATGLRADFRRVEDSYRLADRNLRESIIAAQSHRGEILDELLNGHDELLETPEGQVFHGFFQQLTRGAQLAQSKQRLRTIINHPVTRQALSDQQRSDLRWLFIRLNRESATVLRTRERSERDVKGFLQTGLVTEHHRVGALLDELLCAALDIDWSQKAVRERNSHLPPVAPANNNLPLVERLRFKSENGGQEHPLDLGQQQTDLKDIDADFWLSFASLDQQRLFNQTYQLLQEHPHGMSIAEIAKDLPPSHDLESIAFWLGMARETGQPFQAEEEVIDIAPQEKGENSLRFHIPKVELTTAALDSVEWEL